MVEHPAVAAVRDRAVALLQPGMKRAVATDIHTFSRTTQKPPAALIGIAVPGEAMVIAVDLTEYDPLDLATLLGFPPAEPETALERIERERYEAIFPK